MMVHQPDHHIMPELMVLHIKDLEETCSASKLRYRGRFTLHWLAIQVLPTCLVKPCGVVVYGIEKTSVSQSHLASVAFLHRNIDASMTLDGHFWHCITLVCFQYHRTTKPHGTNGSDTQSRNILYQFVTSLSIRFCWITMLCSMMFVG